jgi:hypothetical protein
MLGLFAASGAHADWHGGKLVRIQVAYDGNTITFVTTGYTRNNCTCYASWPDSMCLNRDHVSFKEEVALVYLARAKGSTLSYNIDETTCSVLAMYESD